MFFDKDINNMWLTWIEQIESFSRLPGFLGMLLKNEKCSNILFDMIMGKSEFAGNNSSSGQGINYIPGRFYGHNHHGILDQLN
jgi:hypothetical protein